MSNVGSYVENPRRVPRIRARFQVKVGDAGVPFAAETFDVSATGCQLATTGAMRAGETTRLAFEAPRDAQGLSVTGAVAWISGNGRLRAGIQFTERDRGADPGAWFRRFAPGPAAAAAIGRSQPERLPLDTRLFLRPPPRFIFDFAPGELRIVEALGDGTTIAQLMRDAAIDVRETARMVFALLEQRVITLHVGEAAPAWRWRAAMAEVAASGERPAPPPSSPAPLPPPPPSRVAAEFAASLRRASPARDPAPAHVQRVEAALRRQEAAQARQEAIHVGCPPERPPPPPAIPRTPVSTPPSGPHAGVRSAEAQECLDLAGAAASIGEISTAIGLLRRGIQLAPRDPEIAALLGALAFRDRKVETH